MVSRMDRDQAESGTLKERLRSALPARVRGFKLSPINQRRLRNFNANRRGRISLYIFLTVFVVTLFAANLWGLFEVALPWQLSTALGNAKSPGLAGHFLTGALATFFSFSRSRFRPPWQKMGRPSGATISSISPFSASYCGRDPRPAA